MLPLLQRAYRNAKELSKPQLGKAGAFANGSHGRDINYLPAHGDREHLETEAGAAIRQPELDEGGVLP